MYSININKKFNTLIELSNALKEITNSIETGVDNGIDWTITISDRDKKISEIKKIISLYGETTVFELNLDSTPIYDKNIDGTILNLIETFYQNEVEITTYHNNIEYSTYLLPYEYLSDELINEIYIIMDNYRTSQPLSLPY